MLAKYTYNTKIAPITIVEENEKIIQVQFNSKENNQIEIKETELIQKTYKQINEYLEGKRKQFDIPINLRGTEFMQKVWKALINIPYAQTKTYQEIAQEIKKPKACRAVGMANHNNPIAIIVPCHRVIGKNGKLVGYAGGIAIKEKLLEIEAENK